MKKQTLFTISLLLITKLLFSQATRTPNTWGLASDYLGWDATVGSPPLLIKTTNPDAINFATGNVQRATITPTGFVGIGTAAPVTTLDVNGTITTKQIIVENQNTKQDLLVLIEHLQKRVAALEQQLTASSKN